MIKGTDLAFPIQGDVSDAVWKALADDGHGFTIMRLLVGNETWSDQAAVKRHIDRAKRFGIRPTAYGFAYPLRHIDPKAWVERFVKLLEGLGCNPGELPPAIDCEWPPREEWKKDPDPTTDVNPDGTKKQRNAKGEVMTFPWKRWNVDASSQRDWYLAALAHLEAITGITPLCYSFRYYLKCIEVEKAPEFGRYPLWLADYTYQSKWVDDVALAKIKPPAPWSKITIVQHDGNGGLRLPISGVDADFNMFPGDEAALDELAAGVGNVEAHDAIIVDLDAARQEARGILLEEEIARYRRERIDAA